MKNFTIQINDVETGKVIFRDMTAQEIKQYENDLQKAEQEAAQAATAKAALLERLGITEQEAKLLFG